MNESDKNLNMSEFDKDNNANVILDGRKFVIPNSRHPSHTIPIQVLQVPTQLKFKTWK